MSAPTDGLKIAIGKSTIYGKKIQRIREIAEAGVFPSPKKTVTITKKDIISQYLSRITKDVKLKRKLRKNSRAEPDPSQPTGRSWRKT